MVGPIATQSDFERLAEDVAGMPMPIYGRQLFDQVPTTFAPISEVPVPSDYVIGPGDQLIIQIWGKIDLNTRVTVDRNGQFFLPRIGALSVAGLHYNQLQSYIQAAVGNLYKYFDLNVTMGQLRSIQIFVLGSARRPGVYTVSSLSTLVDALFASGGPSATGSMRRIELRRRGQTVTVFDVYNLLRKGDKSHDVPLLPGDIIYIPTVGPQVAIMGSVNEPAIYELDGETTISAALVDAGGLTSLAGTQRVQLERVENHQARRVENFPLDASAFQRPLRDGDMLRIFPISPQFENAVTLRGNVAQPGRYPWHQGMRISDLIPSRDFLITRSYWIRQNHLLRNTEGNPGWNPQGNVHNSSGTEIPGNQPGAANSSEAPFEGWQQQTAWIDTAPTNMMSEIVRDSSEINWDYASIERLDEHDLSTRLIAFNLGNAIDDPVSADNQVLRPGDVVTIFSLRDMPLPMDKHAMFVRVDGEVNAPGVYRVHRGESLREAVEQAGGLTSHSYLYASQLTRLSTQRAEEQELKQSAAEMQRELASRYAAAPTLNSANTSEQQAQLSAQQVLLAQLAAVHPTGRIVLDMKPEASTVNDIPVFPLENGDSYYIPSKLSTVQVAGAVYNPDAFRYEPRKRLSAYLSDAGGPTREADKRRIFLIRADGTVVSSQNHGELWRTGFGSMVLLPGDAIIVPTKLKAPGGFMQQLPFVMQVLSETAITGAVVGTTY
jgi:protein involved in polysaccharide export with SLBB domain